MDIGGYLDVQQLLLEKLIMCDREDDVRLLLKNVDFARSSLFPECWQGMEEVVYYCISSGKWNIAANIINENDVSFDNLLFKIVFGILHGKEIKEKLYPLIHSRRKMIVCYDWAIWGILLLVTVIISIAVVKKLY